MKKPTSSDVRLKIRIVFESGAFMGPGKADLLEGIRDTGSIAAAGRRMAMSYKRAWTLVETLNSMFASPLVASTRGGAEKGGAELTELGRAVLENYRAFERKAAKAGGAELSAMTNIASGNERLRQKRTR